MLVHEHYLYINHGMFFSKTFMVDVCLTFLEMYYLFQSVQRTFKSNIHKKMNVKKNELLKRLTSREHSEIIFSRLTKCSQNA